MKKLAQKALFLTICLTGFVITIYASARLLAMALLLNKIPADPFPSRVLTLPRQRKEYDLLRHMAITESCVSYIVRAGGKGGGIQEY